MKVAVIVLSVVLSVVLGAPSKFRRSYNSEESIDQYVPNYQQTYQNYEAPRGSKTYKQSSSSLHNTGYIQQEDDEDQHEPASYSYEYKIEDDHAGNNFGHRESRQDDSTQGSYFVVLPDGRKQIVNYEADKNGYRAKISYEDGYQQSGEPRQQYAQEPKYNVAPAQENHGGYY